MIQSQRRQHEHGEKIAVSLWDHWDGWRRFSCSRNKVKIFLFKAIINNFYDNKPARIFKRKCNLQNIFWVWNFRDEFSNFRIISIRLDWCFKWKITHCLKWKYFGDHLSSRKRWCSVLFEVILKRLNKESFIGLEQLEYWKLKKRDASGIQIASWLLKTRRFDDQTCISKFIRKTLVETLPVNYRSRHTLDVLFTSWNS